MMCARRSVLTLDAIVLFVGWLGLHKKDPNLEVTFAISNIHSFSHRAFLSTMYCVAGQCDM